MCIGMAVQNVWKNKRFGERKKTKVYWSVVLTTFSYRSSQGSHTAATDKFASPPVNLARQSSQLTAEKTWFLQKLLKRVIMVKISTVVVNVLLGIVWAKVAAWLTEDRSDRPPSKINVITGTLWACILIFNILLVFSRLLFFAFFGIFSCFLARRL